MKKISQKEAVFYLLWKSKKLHPEEFIPAWKFTGEIEIAEFKQWILLSYTAPRQLSSIFYQNPDLIERIRIKGKSGSHYFTYRIAPSAPREKLLDSKLVTFVDKLLTH